MEFITTVRTQFPRALMKWNCEWEQCVSYPLTTVRVTVQHKQQSEVCTIHTSVLLVSRLHTAKYIYAEKKRKVNLCSANTCHETTSLFYTIECCGDIARNLCHEPHKLCFMLAGFGQADMWCRADVTYLVNSCFVLTCLVP